MQLLKAIFWDLDGTLADTEMYGHRLAFNESFRVNGLNWYWDIETYRELLKIHGGLNRICFFAKNSEFRLAEDKLKIINYNKQLIYRQKVNQGLIPLRTGVMRLFNQLRNNHIQQFVVTTSSSESALPLIRNNFNDFSSPFNQIITSDHIKKTKPNPECYLKAIELSGFDNSEILVIEDSPTGLHAAKDADLNCLITISPWDNYSDIKFGRANAVVDHLGEQDQSSTIFKGLTPNEMMINLEYLEQLTLESEYEHTEN